MLPILRLNGSKITNPAVLARIGTGELTELLRGFGHEPHFVVGDDALTLHQQPAETLDTIVAKIHAIQTAARVPGQQEGRNDGQYFAQARPAPSDPVEEVVGEALLPGAVEC